MDNQPNQQTIDLHELWAILVKRKMAVIGITAAITAMAIAYVLLAKPVYEATSIIEAAQIDKKAIQSIEDIKEKVEFVYQVNLKDKITELPRISSVAIPKNSTLLMVIKAQGHDNTSAQKKLQEAIGFVVHEQSEEIKSYIENKKKQSALVEQSIADNENALGEAGARLKNYEAKLLNLSKADSALGGEFYAIEMARLQSEIRNMESKRFALKERLESFSYALSASRIKDARMVGGIGLSEKPIKPKKMLTVVVASATGLMLGIFIAFLGEFLSGGRKEKTGDR